MRYDRYGDAYDTARAWVTGRGAPDEWRHIETEEVELAEEVDDTDHIDAAAADLVEAGVLEGIVEAEPAAASTWEAPDYDDGHMSNEMFSVQMMVMESQNNASMMAISGIGGYHDTNYNGYIDGRDLGLSNTWGSMG